MNKQIPLDHSVKYITKIIIKKLNSFFQIKGKQKKNKMHENLSNVMVKK